MKLTKTQIKGKQEELVETILKLDALGKQKKSLVAILDDDFNENEAKYRNGIVTPKGVLVRKPRWDVVAKVSRRRRSLDIMGTILFQAVPGLRRGIVL